MVGVLAKKPFVKDDLIEVDPDQIIISTGYRPRKHQKYIHTHVNRFTVLVCHRRFGKTVTIVNEIIDRALSNPLRNPQYAYIAPTYRQAKRIAWQYFKDFTRNIPNSEPKETELTIFIHRPDRVCPMTGELEPDVIKLMLIGADDPDDIRGIYLDGAGLDEFAKCDPIVWRQVVRPALSDRKKIAQDMGVFYDYKGMPLVPWAIVSGTPKGQNHFHKMKQEAEASQKYVDDYESKLDAALEEEYWIQVKAEEGIDEDLPEVDLNRIKDKWSESKRRRWDEWVKYNVSLSWSYMEFKGSETGILGLEELSEMRRDLTPEEYDQEVECSFTGTVLGSYWGHQLKRAEKEGRICSVPYDKRFPVDTFWDLGVGDKCTIWFRQKVSGHHNYIYYYENSGKGVAHYEEVIRALGKPKGFETVIGRDDGTFETIIGQGYRYGRHVWPHDGATKEFGSGQSRQETARKLGLFVEIQTRHTIDDGIQAARERINISYFDKDNCARGLECITDYQRLYDEKLMVFKETPLHNWASHGADAFRYSSMDDRTSQFQDGVGKNGYNNKKIPVITNYRVYPA